MDAEQEATIFRIGENINNPLLNYNAPVDQEQYELLVANNQQTLARASQNNENRIDMLSIELAKTISQMGEKLSQAIEKGFQKSSEDLNRNRAEVEDAVPGPSSSRVSTHSKGKRKIGPASLIGTKNPIKKPRNQKSDTSELEDNDDDQLSLIASDHLDSQREGEETQAEEADDDLRVILQAGRATEPCSSEEDVIGNLLSDFNYEDKFDLKIGDDSLAKAIDKVW